MITDASLVVKSYIPERDQKQVCVQSTQELHTRAGPEAGMCPEHPRATYQSGARSRYAFRAPKSYIPGQGQRQVCIQSTQELHTRAGPEAGMHSEHPRATYQDKARGRYAFRAPKSYIPGQGQRQVCIFHSQELHTYASKKLPRCIQKKGAESSPQEALHRGNKSVCSQGRGSFIKRSTTTMYFKRWGLLAPPPGKVSFLKNILALLSPHGYYSTTVRGVQHAAYRRAGVQEAITCTIYNVL
jgi:hypothetical protein